MLVEYFTADRTLIVSFFRIGNFWKKRLGAAALGGIAEREYPYGQTYHPEQQQQAEAVQA